MKEIQLINACFSPTGTTCQVARAIAVGFGCSVTEMDLSVSDCMVGQLQENTVLLAAAPVYGGRIPAVALERLSQLRGRGQKAVAVVVYGNREFDDALLELKDALTSNGFQVVAAAAFIAEHSIIRSIAAGRPDEKDLAIARKFGADVAVKLETLTVVEVPGKDPYLAVKPSTFHPFADEACVKCGVCGEKCPVGAIPMEDPSQTNNDLCINCMRCVKVCPVQCRALPAPFIAGATKMLNEKASGYKEPQIFGI